MRVYLSGSISHGDTLPSEKVAENIQRFHDAASELRARGYEVLCPVEGEPENATWAEYMRRDIAMVIEAEGIVVLPEWWRSRGSRLEVDIGRALGMPVKTIDEALKAAASADPGGAA